MPDVALIGEFGAAARDEDPDREQDTFKFYGEEFVVADAVGAMPLLRFASTAADGVEAEEMEGLAAMHELLRDCLASESVEVERDGEKVTLHGWPRFQKVAAENKVGAAELMTVCGAIYRAVTGRPTKRPSVSADGSLPTTASLKAPSSSEGSSPQDWRNTAFGRRELAAVPELYEDVLSISEAGAEILQTQRTA